MEEKATVVCERTHGKIKSAWLTMKTKQATTVTLYIIVISFEISYVLTETEAAVTS